MNIAIKAYYVKLFGIILAILGMTSSPVYACNCESATIIYNVPYYISSPGTYCLSGNLKFTSTSNSSTSAIIITASNVVLDFNGMILSGRWENNTASTGRESGVTLCSGASGHPNDVVIRNGTGTYSGTTYNDVNIPYKGGTDGGGNE